MTWRAAAVMACLLALVCAPSAGAATASVIDGTLTYAAGVGETNSVSIALDPAVNGYAITDTGALPVGGQGCGAIDHEVDCEDKNISVIVINLRDGNDKWTGGDIKVVPSVDGGSGDDDLEGIGFLGGGDGNDTLKGLDSGA